MTVKGQLELHLDGCSPDARGQCGCVCHDRPRLVVQMRLPFRAPCLACGADMTGRRRHARTCSPACRMALSRALAQLRKDRAQGVQDGPGRR